MMASSGAPRARATSAATTTPPRGKPQHDRVLVAQVLEDRRQPPAGFDPVVEGHRSILAERGLGSIGSRRFLGPRPWSGVSGDKSGPNVGGIPGMRTGRPGMCISPGRSRSPVVVAAVAAEPAGGQAPPSGNLRPAARS